MRARRASLIADLLLPVLVFGAALWVFAGAAQDLPFHGDELHYIGTTRYFELLVLRGDVSHPDWGDNYWTHTQPMLGRYLVGGSLWAHGYDLQAMPEPYYDFDASLEENRQAGRVPARALIQAARLPSTLLAAGAAALLALTVRVLGGSRGWSGGLAAALLLVANPLARQHLPTATPDAALIFFLLLALLLALRGARPGESGRLPLRWAIPAGLALGLALQAKLTAAFSLTAMAAWAIGLAFASWRRRPQPSLRHPRASFAPAVGWAIAALLALGLFVAGNPHLYPNPVRHTAHLVEQRGEEMAFQRQWQPEAATGGWLDRLRYVLGGGLVIAERRDGDPSAWRGLPITAVLAPIGAVVLAMRARRCWRAGGRSAEWLVLLTALLYLGGTAATIHMYWPRYLIPACLITSLLSGIAVAALTPGAALTHGVPGPDRAAPQPGKELRE